MSLPLEYYPNASACEMYGHDYAKAEDSNLRVCLDCGDEQEADDEEEEPKINTKQFNT